RATVGTDVVTGGSLKPRTGEQTEIGVKYQFPDSESFITVAYFDLEEDNLIDFVAGGQTQSGLSIESDGFEIEALVAFEQFSVDFTFRDMDAEEIDQNGDALPRPSEPETTASIWLNWTPQGELNGLRLGLGARYASENESNGTAFLAANGFAPTPVRIETEAYTVFDAMIGYEFENNLDLTLNFRNIGDEEYYSTCLSRGDCFPAERRTIVGTLSMRL
ncbi:MAG: TonB-dependent receptor, partial [Pseudomonadota bacterium]